jgi:hypothetical protein
VMPLDNVSFPDVRDALARISKGKRATTPSLTPDSLLRFWLWGSDANEFCDRSKCDFHLMHLTGMVCTRVFSEAYLSVDDAPGTIPAIVDDEDITMLTEYCGIFLPHFHTVSKTQDSEKCDVVTIPTRVSLQQLRDLVNAIQTQWPQIQAAVEEVRKRNNSTQLLQAVDRLVTQLFVWFGGYLFDSRIQECQADDKEFVDIIPPTNTLALTVVGIKFYTNIFYILFRLLFLQRHSVSVPTGRDIISGSYPFAVETFHVEAGVDDFHLIGMYVDIPAGCLLEYKHSYSGYYNNVSQCVYKHFPSYKRRIPVTLEEVSLENATDLSVLPSLKQIYPEIEFAFEDHHFQRDFGTVRMAVLLAPKQSSLIHTEKTPQTANNSKPCPESVTKPYKVSEKLQTRIDICQGGKSGNDDSGVLEGGNSVRTVDWYWFVIGSNVYLVCTKDGMVYRGRCRDLLSFYLSVM